MATDASGVEALEGESEAEYVARQTRLREEAAERMRAKFGASGGLNGGMRMGGIGSQPVSGGGGWGLGGSLSSLGGSLSNLAAASLDVASTVKERVKEKVSEKVSFDSGRDLAHLRNGSSNSVVEGSKDLSDLLGGCGFDAPPSSRAMPVTGGGRAVADDGWGDDGWGASVPSGIAPSPVASSALAPKPSMVPAPMPSMAPAAPAKPASTHFGGASGSTPKKKVAAVKVSKDAGWDDWGDDKW